MVRVVVVHGAKGHGGSVSGTVDVCAPGPLRLDSADAVGQVEAMLAARTVANRAFFEVEAGRIAKLCSRMADRFGDGGRLIAVGASPAARSDVRHVAVEFVHPVIVGKRALPAIGLTGESASLAAQVTIFARPQDIVIAFGSVSDGEASQLVDAIAAGRARGCLTIAMDRLGAEFEFDAPSSDAFVWQELVETLYHVLWELVHVYVDHGARTSTSAAAHPGNSAFLYPFLTQSTRDLVGVTSDVTRSVMVKAAEVGALRERSFAGEGAVQLAQVAAVVRARLDAGGTVLAFGNGGSATDAMDFVADLCEPPSALGATRRSALDLTADSSIITALTNDVGPDVVFARQIIAYGSERDVAVGFSTSGSSRNVIAAFAEARSRGLLTVCFAGYDGGRIAAERLADHVIVASSEYVPRIQEAHATAYHAIRVLIG